MPAPLHPDIADLMLPAVQRGYFIQEDVDRIDAVFQIDRKRLHGAAAGIPAGARAPVEEALAAFDNLAAWVLAMIRKAVTEGTDPLLALNPPTDDT